MIMINCHPERIEALLAARRVLPTPDDPDYEIPDSISATFDDVDQPDNIDKRLIDAGGFEGIPEDEGEGDDEGEESRAR